MTKAIAADGSVVWCALRHRASIVSSDADDLRRLHPTVAITPL